MKHRSVVIGVSTIQQKGDFENLDEALLLMDQAVKEALSDSGNKSIKDQIDEIRIPKGFWRYRDPGKWIAKNNDFKKIPTTHVAKIGVLQQNLINEACLKIENGEINAAIILGGEARYKQLRSIIEKKEYSETKLDENPDFYIKAKEDLYGDEELKELGAMAVGYYASMETAIRKNDDETIEEHQNNIASMYEEFSKVASNNEDAWLDHPYSREEILVISKKNKMLAYPYNKLHCTSWNVNQSAALIICSEELANKLEIDNNKRVYPISSSENNHMIAIQQRPKLYESLGMIYAAKSINKMMKKLDIRLDAYDLYSCFPAAVKMFSKSLELGSEIPKTITGSMPYAGGPLNSFVIHSTVKMIQKIRALEVRHGLVTGVSGMMTKQSFCVWGKEYQKQFIFDDVTERAKLDENPVELSNIAEGEGEIIGYTIIQGSDNAPKAVLYLDDEKKHRKVVSSLDKNFINLLMEEEWVGKKVKFKDGQATP
ncbi:MAG: acetyl-CoA acetyltransferase [SAR92 clade bacterium]|uniref:Acetyl-CoA acetyltransferase n=1 Tax=SAR92 clade bacterium TaxID=2315479 RepID=A0A520LJS3_9GAMM|nr:acetyl-CoA acetyltransferase [Flavobacteriaceae bacterium]RZO03771.1 MAG: acetyl-CoA acetyltransferase [SAR92 clade bacterium]|tara:strand:- start:1533 stop:2987 length:1455 start_codon:yes stop_codon:yes gene_type:complete